MCGLVKGGVIGCVVALLVVLLFDIKSSGISYLIGAVLTNIGTIFGDRCL